MHRGLNTDDIQIGDWSKQLKHCKKQPTWFAFWSLKEVNTATKTYWTIHGVTSNIQIIVKLKYT